MFDSDQFNCRDLQMLVIFNYENKLIRFEVIKLEWFDAEVFSLNILVLPHLMIIDYNE